MTEPKHTPGPWRVDGDGPNPNMGLWSVEGVGNVANRGTLADATLIASAPDLLAFAGYAAGLAVGQHADPLATLQEIAEQARVVLAKAATR